MKSNIAIIGGGIAGLSAGYELLKKNKELDIKIFEKEPYIGGLLGSINIDGYNIEVYYHHTFPDDDALYILMDELGIRDKIEWHTGKVGFLFNGKMYGFNTATDLLKFPVINFWEKFRVGMAVFRAKKVKDWREYDNVSAKEYITTVWGESIYKKLWVPLLRAKFGPNMEKISAAWFIRRIQLRSHRDAKGEQLAYPKGGWQILIDKLVEKIEALGGQIKERERVTKIAKKDEKYIINTEKGEYEADYIISTIPQPIFNKISFTELPPVSYQGCLSVILTLKRKVQDYYWINISDEDVAFSVMVEHSNFFKENPYPYHIIYLALYTEGNRMEKDEIEEKKREIVESFREIFHIDESDILKSFVYYSSYAGPVYETGYKEKLPPKKIPGENIWIGGMPRSYPERSINDSLLQGIECADEILEVL